LTSMVSYAKFQKVEDSDEEAENAHSDTLRGEEMSRRRDKQEQMSRWLKEMIAGVQRDEAEGKRDYQSSANKQPVRKVTREERDALAMFIVICYTTDGDTNLSRHQEITRIILDYRWMQDDPALLELLCRVHLRVSNSKELTDLEENKLMNAMVLSAINTLAAAAESEKGSNLVELFSQICTPTTEKQRELRRKWETKEFAKEAILTSMFPDLAKYKDYSPPEAQDFTKWELALYILMAVIAIALFGVVMYMTMHLSTKTSRRAHHVSSDLPAPSPPAIEVLPERGEL